MTQMKLIDVEVTVSLAVDGSMTWEQIQAWVEAAIEAKMYFDAEQEDWGAGLQRVYPNGPIASNAHLASAQ